METPLSPLEFARRARKLYSNREAVVDGTRRLTYGEFFDRCDRWSHSLQQLGISQGDRVAYLSPNTTAHLEGYYAVPQIGAITVPVNFRLAADDFVYILNHSGTRVVCAAAEHLDVIDRIRPRLESVQQFVALEGCQNGARPGWLDYEDLLRNAETWFSEPEIRESDTLSINYTSGTTALPKGVMITHRNAWLNVIGTLVHVPMSASDRYVWTVPMFHANGWTFVWTVTAVGGTHLCLRRAEPRAIFELLQAERGNFLCAAPTVLISIAGAPESVRGECRQRVRVITAGAPPAAATIERVEGELGWEITQVYGLTEVSPFISICEPRPEHGELTLRERGVVKARQGVELITSGDLRVFDDQDRDVPADGESLGEIVVRGNAVMAGYYQDPEGTQRAIRGGWFRTGDAAVVHPDGYLEIRDRLKDVIISGGENISSVEVEGVLLRHPAVLEVAVVGVPDEKWGETPHAFVVLRPGADLEDGELRRFAREQLAHFKVPSHFSVVTELPKTATGKIQKYVLRGGRANLAAQ